jgi:hypothetical protein
MTSVWGGFPTSTFGGGFPSGFGGMPGGGLYDTFFTDPFLSDWDMDISPDEQNRYLLTQQAQQGEPRAGPSRAERRAAGRRARQQALEQRQTARVNLVQEEEKYCVCVEVPGRTKDDLCVSLEANSQYSIPSLIPLSSSSVVLLLIVCSMFVLCCVVSSEGVR